MTNKFINILCCLVVMATFAMIVAEHGQQPRRTVDVNQTEYKPKN
jgi:hypothetical protein